MKVRMLCEVSDELRGYVGDEVVELPDDKAARFIKAGVAVAAEKGKGPEAAALADAPERAALPPPAKRGA